MKYEIITTPEYKKWLSNETFKARVQIAERLKNIENEGHFGSTKNLKNDIFELKWINGRRIYYALIPTTKVLLLLGGNKNGQDKDIKKAKKIYRKYT